jgi:pimeloyl-ACP methyl ester carboxylesterase
MPEIIARGLRFHVQRLGPWQREGTESASPSASAPLVVFLHGLVMDNLSSLYFTLAGPAADRADVLLYDLRGHGMSERPAVGYGLDDMVADLDAVLLAATSPAPLAPEHASAGPRPLVLVGNSFGGLLALAFAAAHPGRALGLALIDGHLGGSGWAAQMAATLGLEGEARDARIGASFGAWLGRQGERKATRLARTATALVHHTSLVRDLEASGGLTREDLARVTCPVLALYGASSDLRPEAERASAELPACDLRIFDGCTHSILWEQTDRVRREVLDFLDFIFIERVRAAPA